MTNQDWFGIMKILELKLWKGDQLIWECENIRNVLHLKGEQFLLEAVFTGGQANTFIPTNYYLGLDNRPAVSAGDTINSLIGEPNVGGYSRQQVSSTGTFIVSLDNTTGHYMAVSPVVTFSASAGGLGWGPTQVLFLTDKADNTGTLISSAFIPNVVNVDPGTSVTMRLGMLLKDCP